MKRCTHLGHPVFLWGYPASVEGFALEKERPRTQQYPDLPGDHYVKTRRPFVTSVLPNALFPTVWFLLLTISHVQLVLLFSQVDYIHFPSWFSLGYFLPISKLSRTLKVNFSFLPDGTAQFVHLWMSLVSSLLFYELSRLMVNRADLMSIPSH